MPCALVIKFTTVYLQIFINMIKSNFNHKMKYFGNKAPTCHMKSCSHKKNTNTHLYSSHVWSHRWCRHNYPGRSWVGTQHRCCCIHRTVNSLQSQISSSAAGWMERDERKDKMRLHHHTMTHTVTTQSVSQGFLQGNICRRRCSHTVCMAHRFPHSWRNLRHIGTLPHR